MAMFVGIMTAVVLLGADASAPANCTGPPVYCSFHYAFSQEMFQTEQIDKILLRFFSESIDKTRWPFTNQAKELIDSTINPANDNAETIKAAITTAGGNPADIASLTPQVCGEAHRILGKVESPSSAFLESGTHDPSTIMYLTRAVSMVSGSVASNTAALKGLTNVVAINSYNIKELSTAVSVLSEVTQPTAMLAASMGLPVSAVSSMALAGAFLGPLLGVVAMVYVAWPEEEVDPWLKVESRVAQMVHDKFDAQRRTRLGDRLRRYVKQFSRCSQAWVADGLVNFHGLSIPRHIVDEAKLAQGKGGIGFDLQFSKAAQAYPAPPCTQQLEAQMSLERDEWFKADNGQISGLFMPFANMHTQLLSMLSDHPFEDEMQWESSLKSTAAEYANYMLSHLLSAWKAQACRTMRLRHSLKNGFWEYQFVVLKAVAQPNAAVACDEKCGAHPSGWCNFCGGQNVGACCKQGEGGVCAAFVPPVAWLGGVYSACVHTDCVQSNTGYYGTKLKSFGPRENGAPRDQEECQQMCRNVLGAVAFTLNNDGLQCTCLGEKGLQRHQEVGAFSGPLDCKAQEQTIKQMEEAFETTLNETTKVPMTEAQVCDKSPTVSNFAELEADHEDWVRTCYTKATTVAIGEYNNFYKRFADFVDMLTWKAGCGAQHAVDWQFSAKDGDGMLAVSEAFDGGSFGDCDWDREDEMDKKMWVFDESRAQGWTGTNRVNMEEQAKMNTQYPMPSWLHDLRRVHPCLKNTAAGRVTNANSGISTAIDDALGPAGMDENEVNAPSTVDDDYERMLREAMER